MNTLTSHYLILAFLVINICFSGFITWLLLHLLKEWVEVSASARCYLAENHSPPAAAPFLPPSTELIPDLPDDEGDGARYLSKLKKKPWVT